MFTMIAKHENILTYFSQLEDPRVDRTKVHRLEVILFISICTFLSGGSTFNHMELFAKTRGKWLEENIGMVSPPSHDTFNRVFQALDPEALGQILTQIALDFRGGDSCGDIIAIDGKTHRGTKVKDKPTLHMLNAWSTKYGLSLGLLPVPEKSNEITAFPQLLDLLEVRKAIVTADALNCQKSIAEKIIEKKADYMLAIKGNQQSAFEEIKQFMDLFAASNEPGIVTTDGAHGRVEIRKYWQSTDIKWFEDKGLWKKLKSFCMVESIRKDGDEREENRRYYISSLGDDIELASKAIRSHWQVENCLHWVLDVTFREDESRVRERNAAKNLGVLRSVCVNILKRNQQKISMSMKRYKASLDRNFLLELLKV